MSVSARFIRAFRIVPTSLLSVWHDVSQDEKPIGDCQAFAWSVMILETGSKAKAIKAMLTLRAVVFRGWSKPGLPRHAILWMRGKGFIDSSNREWRKWPWPCVPIWPAGAPVVVGLAVAAKAWGIW